MRLVASLLALASMTAGAQAQGAPRPVELYKQMAEVSKVTGWGAFGGYGGGQWIYFTPPVIMHCGLESISYSFNSTDLDRTFPLPQCNPDMPFLLLADAGPETITLAMLPGSAETVAVAVKFSDGLESEMLVFKPCDSSGDETGGRLAAQ